jgi:hypothetical protein
LEVIVLKRMKGFAGSIRVRVRPLILMLKSGFIPFSRWGARCNIERLDLKV